MRRSGYTAIPILDDEGRYLGTITEGDLLRKLVEDLDRTFRDTEELKAVIRPVGIEANVEELLTRAVEQNFVPVIDGRGAFIGIVRRSAIIGQCAGVLSQRAYPAGS